jgi:hypothetical protein
VCGSPIGRRQAAQIGRRRRLGSKAGLVATAAVLAAARLGDLAFARMVLPVRREALPVRS